jgi:hypothetical protein
MKNTFRIIGIIALLAVIGFSMAACDNDSTKSPLEGTWKTQGTGLDGSVMVFTFKFTGSDFSFTYEKPIGNVVSSDSGTFSYTDTAITFKRTKPSTETYTQNYTITGKTLRLQSDENNYGWAGTLTKQ